MKDEIVEFVGRLNQAAGFDLDVRVDEDADAPGDYRVVLSGPDRGILLGRTAELLDAIEYVTNRAFGRQIRHDAKIVFDSGNYRALREAELRLMAEKAAERVKASKTPFVFDPMSPSERRIIHVALTGIDGIRTESAGDGTERRVRVVSV